MLNGLINVYMFDLGWNLDDNAKIIVGNLLFG